MAVSVMLVSVTAATTSSSMQKNAIVSEVAYQEAIIDAVWNGLVINPEIGDVLIKEKEQDAEAGMVLFANMIWERKSKKTLAVADTNIFGVYFYAGTAKSRASPNTIDVNNSFVVDARIADDGSVSICQDLNVDGTSPTSEACGRYSRASPVTTIAMVLKETYWKMAARVSGDVTGNDEATMTDSVRIVLCGALNC